MLIKKTYKINKKIRIKKTHPTLYFMLSVLGMCVGLYGVLLTKAPQLSLITPSSITLNTLDDEGDERNRIQIEKIGLEVPYFTGGEDMLNKGAWWRHEDRGNPERGGNFILSAHRFNLGLTPQGTKARSPFYRIEELQTGDSIRVYYSGVWYDYTIRKRYIVEPTAIEIEAPTQESKLTLYACTLGGSDDGRVVVEAIPETSVSMR